MQFPKKIIDKANSVIAEKNARDARQKALEEITRQKELAEQEKIKVQRTAKRVELDRAANTIVDWLGEFYTNPDSLRIFSAKKTIMLFVDKFWLGRPALNSQTTWATIEITENEMFYREYHKGHSSHEQLLGKTVVAYKPKSIFNPDEFYCRYVVKPLLTALLHKLHPDFLEAFALAIQTGQVWKRIEQSLAR
ncbi:MAG: hypothetical protein V1661_01280 [bacterium]